jgi:P27 family predicted phage terminase small subunit
MRGRKPTPNAVKEVMDNPGKRPINKDEPVPPPGIPDCPEHLSADGKAEWARVVPQLEAMGLLSGVDRSALAAYCEAYASWVDAVRNLQRFGKVLKAPKSGHPMPNPYVSIANQSLEHMRKFMTEFGMTPSSRSRLSVKNGKPNQDADPAEKYFNDLGAGSGNKLCN